MTGRKAQFARIAEGLVARADGLAALGWRPAGSTRDGLAKLARSGG